MSPGSGAGEGAHEDAFRRLYATHFDAVLGFALRRVDRPEDAADVAADTFLVAWRRLAHAPAEPETRPWLYGVARRVLANHRRGEGRRSALGDRLRRELATVAPDPSADVVQRADVTAAMRRLSGRDQEVLQLHLWEGLESREIAEVLGLTTVVVRPRLSRARARLRALLPEGPERPGRPDLPEPRNGPASAGHLPSTPQLIRKER
ncbi:RNA polymerase sigma factor [Nocardioides marmotae]|uniref:RNA polymerase sigma factor n=1 Tax=Nocardioides marmotae TaxID=2663857 RepID=UPI0012B52038|nr:sigma-70 family RNA polymerase sigma factor [Nocardioides marmotae]MBC9732730.1 sigma-70 family RNA polymerase sigma factor [Nocardioides marmotae]MTB83847.1 sigma-70 family RNA polymerase sigma factor [Nocardioides marmotae]